MALEDYRPDMERCSRCSFCKWIPLAQVKSWRFAKGCPSVEYNKFQSYSAGGRLAASLSLLEGRCSYTDEFLKIAYSCLLDGMCDVACKVCRYNMQPLETMRELRFRLVEDGQMLPEHMVLIDSLRKENNTMGEPRSERGNWAIGLDVEKITSKKAEVLFHAGCLFSYDRELQEVPRTAITILKSAGVDVGIMGEDEACCGGRIYDMGYKGEFIKYAENNIEAWAAAGVKTVVTSCSDCYHAFKRLYPAYGSDIEVLHTVEFIERLINDGKITFTRNVPLKVTYHDPCHLGRRGEPYVPWSGKEKKVRGQIVVYEPRKPRYCGAQGVFEAPRNVLKAIPGIELVEMERIKEYAWCCGAGGGVWEAFPDFSSWVSSERIEEAKSTGAEALVTACSWCERNFTDAIKRDSTAMKIYDIAELVKQAL